jgi:hypothetical protein
MLSRLPVKHVLLGVALILFLASLVNETLIYAQDSSFLVGLVCLLFGMDYLAWYANPLLAIAGCLMLGNQPRSSFAASLAALALACSAFAIAEIPRNEAGTMAQVIGYGAGFWLWLSSITTLAAAAVYCALRERQAISNQIPLAVDRPMAGEPG